MVQLNMMTAVATIIAEINLMFEVQLPTKVLGYLGSIPRVMHQEKEIFLGQFSSHFAFFVVLRLCF